MRKLFALAFLMLLVTAGSYGQSGNDADQEAAYTKTINQRAEKIVATLAITDAAKASKVRSIIAGQYRNLNNIHTHRDNQVNALKAKGEPKESTDLAIKKVEEETAVKLEKLHASYLNELSANLTKEQVVQVKDGMTYSVAPNTYNSYLDMLPNLTVEQKAQILTWLVEAREHAMDAETSEKKHGWFGKYKGRINNYQSAAGYDFKKEGEAWQKRIKEREEKKNTTKN
jgi:Spy/CpxP family protein refolding chaperone